MDTLTSEELRTLSDEKGGRRVSILLPTHPAAPENQQDPIRLRNLLRVADDELRAAGAPDQERRRILAPARDLVEDGLFWRPQRGGIAIFLSGGTMRLYRLPGLHTEEVVVNERFHVRPLVPTVDRGERFFLLAISRNTVRLYLGDRRGLVDVPLGDIPKSLADALRLDELDEQMQQRTILGTQGAGGPARGDTAFFGSGPESRVSRRYIDEFCKRVSRGLREIVPDRDVPVLLAGVEDLAAEYRQADAYHNILHVTLEGNPELLAQDDLHARAWHIVSEIFDRRREDAEARYRRLAGTGQTSADPAEVVRAAAYGRVDSLFVSERTEWGVFHDESGDVEIHPDRSPGDEDLVDLAATETILHGGEVWAADLADTPLAAVFRY